ncbi:hypothetical protein NQ318_019394 [Aromia moschata]|uniref:Uncharacterized protein n=1 Tax=Aromia moschata TaxID=1265417 RepID=A0AAV8XDX6_9CUCU|nr:hypothetical protein NQ318_019394 [Aromia moschata]
MSVYCNWLQALPVTEKARLKTRAGILCALAHAREMRLRVWKVCHNADLTAFNYPELPHRAGVLRHTTSPSALPGTVSGVRMYGQEIYALCNPATLAPTTTGVCRPSGFCFKMITRELFILEKS